MIAVALYLCVVYAVAPIIFVCILFDEYDRDATGVMFVGAISVLLSLLWPLIVMYYMILLGTFLKDKMPTGKGE